MTVPHELRTPRLLLRHLEQRDIPTLVRLAGTREIAATTMNIPHPYAERDAQEFLAHASEEFRSGLSVAFAICVSPERDLCGVVGMHMTHAHQRAELGYWIGVPFWGKGYATEAARAVVAFGFEMLGLNRIYAHHFTENAASGRVLVKIGMRHEGRSRQHIKKWDRFVDVENYGLLRSEFLQEKK